MWWGVSQVCSTKLHRCLARVYECYAEHSMSSQEVMRDRRVARLGGVRGQMGEDLPLNNYMECAEHYLARGVSYAGHLVNICKAIQMKSLLQKIWILFVKTYPCLKPLHATKTKNCLNALDLPFMMPKQSYTTLRGGSNQLCQNKGYFFNQVRIEHK